MRAGKSELPFSQRVAQVWGGLNEIVRTGGDADAAVAAFFQVTVEQLGAWRAAEGRHRCPGVTTRGHSCRNYASAVVDYDPRAWVARDPEFCPTHLNSQQEPAAARPAPPAPVPQTVGRNPSAEDDVGVAAR